MKLCNKWVRIVTTHQNIPKWYFQQFNLLGIDNKGNTTGKCMWIAIVWSILTHRNNITFRNNEKDMEKVFNLAQIKAWIWITNKIPKKKFHTWIYAYSFFICIKSLRSWFLKNTRQRFSFTDTCTNLPLRLFSPECFYFVVLMDSHR